MFCKGLPSVVRAFPGSACAAWPGRSSWGRSLCGFVGASWWQLCPSHQFSLLWHRRAMGAQNLVNDLPCLKWARHCRLRILPVLARRCWVSSIAWLHSWWCSSTLVCIGELHGIAHNLTMDSDGSPIFIHISTNRHSLIFGRDTYSLTNWLALLFGFVCWIMLMLALTALTVRGLWWPVSWFYFCLYRIRRKWFLQVLQDMQVSIYWWLVRFQHASHEMLQCRTDLVGRMPRCAKIRLLLCKSPAQEMKTAVKCFTLQIWITLPRIPRSVANQKSSTLRYLRFMPQPLTKSTSQRSWSALLVPIHLI